MAVFAGPNFVESGLVLQLDAANSKSYPGTGSTWFDLSGNGYNFTINSSAYSTSGGLPHMNFEGSFGAAKRLVNGYLTDIPNFSQGTIVMFSTVLNSTGNWRTLLRGASADHHIIIGYGGNTLGMYDNDASGFNSAGFEITNIPNVYTKFNFMCWRLSQSSPFYQFQYNDIPTIYSITTASSTFNNGFSTIGAYHSGSTDVNDNSQYWGKIAHFAYYNRHLTSAEIKQNFTALRSRYGL